MRVTSRRWLTRLVLVGAVIMLLGGFTQSRLALAHGKELSVEGSSFTPDPQKPLVRLYRALVIYAGDREPATGATGRLTAARQGGGPAMKPVFLEPINEPDLYAAQVVFSMYGYWNVTVRVDELMWEGDASLVEELLPPGPAVDTDEGRRQVLELFFRFGG